MNKFFFIVAVLLIPSNSESCNSAEYNSIMFNINFNKNIFETETSQSKNNFLSAIQDLELLQKETATIINSVKTATTLFKNSSTTVKKLKSTKTITENCDLVISKILSDIQRCSGQILDLTNKLQKSLLLLNRGTGFSESLRFNNVMGQVSDLSTLVIRTNTAIDNYEESLNRYYNNQLVSQKDDLCNSFQSSNKSTQETIIGFSLKNDIPKLTIPQNIRKLGGAY